MAECTDLERELLDAITSGEGRPVHEIRSQIILSRIEPDIFEAMAQAKAQTYRGGAVFERLWNKIIGDASLGHSKAFEVWWASMELRAKEIAGVAIKEIKQ